MKCLCSLVQRTLVSFKRIKAGLDIGGLSDLDFKTGYWKKRKLTDIGFLKTDFLRYWIFEFFIPGFFRWILDSNTNQLLEQM